MELKLYFFLKRILGEKIASKLTGMYFVSKTPQETIKKAIEYLQTNPK